ncbi:excinuclease ABC subunit UvrC [Scrofimicrobium canadense]
MMSEEYLAWRPPTRDIPTTPGVYRFLDAEGRVIYVGKAKNLRARLTNYFQDPALLHPRTAQMVATARSVQWTIVNTEIEALTLEYQWINQLSPRFNVIFRDDKSYPYLSVTMGEEFPRVAISRDRKRKGTRYFGPYAKVWAIRETIDLLIDAFPVRTCSAGVFRRAQAQGRPCLLGYIDRCSAPCVGRISPEDHRKLAEDLCHFMEGNAQPFTRNLEQQMKVAAAAQNYELAAKKRDQLTALRKVQERNQIAFEKPIDADVFALEGDELDVAVHAFYVRGGRVRGTQGWVIERVDERTKEQLLGELLERVYLERAERHDTKKQAPTSIDDVAHTTIDAIPPLLLVSQMPTNHAFLEEWLSTVRGSTVKLNVPARGEKARFVETVSDNASHALQVYRTKRAGDVTQRGVALEELQEALGLESAPLRIECFDISHTGGQHRVASMVVFEDGAPRKDAYRTFNIVDEEEKNDDTAAMSQVLRRRFSHAEDSTVAQPVSGAIDADTGRPRRFSYRPDLLVVDGGLPQVNAAAETLREIGVTVPVVGLAKRLEEVWIPNVPYPVILPRSSASLYLLQHLRDESHRFAIRKHRAKRGKAQTRSALDAIPGLGQTRQKDLLRTFGSLRAIREASVEQLQAAPGIGPSLAGTIHEALSAAKKVEASQ